MTHADRIRQFVIDNYVDPARSAGRTECTVRAGDVHRSMNLRDRMPAVCSAIGGVKFLHMATVSLRDRTGPTNGANVYFCFNLQPERTNFTAPMKKPASGDLPTPANVDLDLTNSLVLVSCVKSKLPYAAPARDLYTSALFTKARSLVETSGARWYVLSSLYGLVEPDAKIDTYDFTLNTLGVAERRSWAMGVLPKLLPEAAKYKRVVIFAGERYREYLIGPLERQGLSVIVPMRGLRFGEQLAWLSDHQ